MSDVTTEPRAWCMADTTDVAIIISRSWVLVLQVEHRSGECSEQVSGNLASDPSSARGL